MTHLRRALLASCRVYWLQALPLDTLDRQRHFPTAAQAQDALRLDSGEHALRRCHPDTMRRLARAHNHRVTAWLARHPAPRRTLEA